MSINKLSHNSACPCKLAEKWLFSRSATYLPYPPPSFYHTQPLQTATQQLLFCQNTSYIRFYIARSRHSRRPKKKLAEYCSIRFCMEKLHHIKLVIRASFFHFHTNPYNISHYATGVTHLAVITYMRHNGITCCCYHCFALYTRHAVCNDNWRDVRHL